MIKLLLMLIMLLSQIAFSQIPINDNCTNATTITPNSNCLAAVSTLSNATQSFAPNFCGAGASATANDVWFSFVATNSVTSITAQPAVVPLSQFNVVMELYNACNSATFIPTPIACADAFGNLQTETISATTLTVGQTYYVRVYQYKNNVGSPNPTDPSFSVCVVATNTLTTILSENTDINTELTIFPNPVLNGEFQIQHINPESSIRLYNALGQNVSFVNSIDKESPTTFHIKYNETLYKGLLLLEIRDKQNKIVNYKIVNP